MIKKIKLSYLVLAFIISLLAFFVVATGAVNSALKDGGQRYDSFYKNVYEYQIIIGEIGERQALTMKNLLKSVYEENGSELRSVLEALSEQNNETTDGIKRLYALLEESSVDKIKAQKPIIESYSVAFETWRASFLDLTSYISSGDKERAKQLLKESAPKWGAVETAFVALRSSFKEIAIEEKAATESKLSKSVLAVQMLTIVLLAAVAILGFLIVKGSMRLERDAFRSKKRLDLIAAGTKDCCCVLSLKSEKLEYYTHGAESFFGAHLSEISSLGGFSENIAKADREKFNGAIGRSADGAPARVIYRYKRTGQGSVCYISTDMYPVFNDLTKKQESVLMVSSDITEKQLLEERSETLTELFENGNYMICVFKNQTQMEYINQAALAFRGISAIEQALSLSFSSFFDSPDLYAKEIPDEIKRPEPMSIMRRVPLRRYDGAIVSVEQTLFAFKDGNGSNKYAVIGQDISDKIVYEEELKAAKTDVHAVKSAKTNIFAALGQRITTPLELLDKMLKDVYESEDGSSAKEEIGEARQQLSSLSELMSNVIDIAKMQTGVLKTEEKQFVLSNTIENLEKRYRTRFESKGLDFDVRTKNIKGSFVGDEKRIVQVLQNLLSNALGYTEKGNVSLSVDIFSKNSEFVIVGFTVADSGCGISDLQLATIFDMKAIDATTHLGLAASKQIALALGGDITVTSVANSGSVLCFTAKLIPANNKQGTENT